MTKEEILESLGFSKEYIEIIERSDIQSAEDINVISIEDDIETEHVVSSTSFVFSSSYE